MLSQQPITKVGPDSEPDLRHLIFPYPVGDKSTIRHVLPLPTYHRVFRTSTAQPVRLRYPTQREYTRINPMEVISLGGEVEIDAIALREQCVRNPVTGAKMRPHVYQIMHAVKNYSICANAETYRNLIHQPDPEFASRVGWLFGLHHNPAIPFRPINSMNRISTDPQCIDAYVFAIALQAWSMSSSRWLSRKHYVEGEPHFILVMDSSDFTPSESDLEAADKIDPLEWLNQSWTFGTYYKKICQVLNVKPQPPRYDRVFNAKFVPLRIVAYNELIKTLFHDCPHFKVRSTYEKRVNYLSASHLDYYTPLNGPARFPLFFHHVWFGPVRCILTTRHISDVSVQLAMAEYVSYTFLSDYKARKSSKRNQCPLDLLRQHNLPNTYSCFRLPGTTGELCLTVPSYCVRIPQHFDAFFMNPLHPTWDHPVIHRHIYSRDEPVQIEQLKARRFLVEISSSLSLNVQRCHTDDLNIVSSDPDFSLGKAYLRLLEHNLSEVELFSLLFHLHFQSIICVCHQAQGNSTHPCRFPHLAGACIRRFHAFHEPLPDVQYLGYDPETKKWKETSFEQFQLLPVSHQSIKIMPESIKLFEQATHYCHATHTYACRNLGDMTLFLSRFYRELQDELSNPRQVFTFLDSTGRPWRHLISVTGDRRSSTQPYYKVIAKQVMEWKKALLNADVIEKLMKLHQVEFCPVSDAMSISTGPSEDVDAITPSLPIGLKCSEMMEKCLSFLRREEQIFPETKDCIAVRIHSSPLSPLSPLRIGLTPGMFMGYEAIEQMRLLFRNAILTPLVQHLTSFVLPLCGPLTENGCLWHLDSSESRDVKLETDLISSSSMSSSPSIEMAELLNSLECSDELDETVRRRSKKRELGDESIKHENPEHDQDENGKEEKKEEEDFQMSVKRLKRGRKSSKIAKSLPVSLEEAEKKIGQLVDRFRLRMINHDNCQQLMKDVREAAGNWVSKMENKSALLAEVSRINEQTPLERVLVLAMLVQSCKRMLVFEPDPIMQVQMQYISQLSVLFELPLRRVWQSDWSVLSSSSSSSSSSTEKTISPEPVENNWKHPSAVPLIKELYTILLRRSHSDLSCLNRLDLSALRSILLRHGLTFEQTMQRLSSALITLDDFVCGKPLAYSYSFLNQGERTSLEMALQRFLAHYTSYQPFRQPGDSNKVERCIVTPPRDHADLFIYNLCRSLLANRYKEVRENKTESTTIGPGSLSISSTGQLTHHMTAQEIREMFGHSSASNVSTSKQTPTAPRDELKELLEESLGINTTSSNNNQKPPISQ